MNSLRKIIHIDMDCFYVAVEMRDFPELSDKPLAIGGAANQRGVIATYNDASYFNKPAFTREVYIHIIIGYSKHFQIIG